MLKLSTAFLVTMMSMSYKPLDDHLQMIVVKTKTWQDFSATVSLYEKNRPESEWKQVKESFPAVVGKNGMGWGRGIYDHNEAINNTFRQEGDKRAPAGIFDIGYAFGIAPKEEAIKELDLKIPYTYLSDTMRCVGEGDSEYYNMVIDTDKVKKDWKDDNNNERMRYEGIRDEMAYKWGFFINHNVDSNPDPDMKRSNNAGSCIFMHMWKNKDTGTSGCTAVEEQSIKTVLRWLDKEKKPVIVQLPESEYQRLKDKWALP